MPRSAEFDAQSAKLGETESTALASLRERLTACGRAARYSPLRCRRARAKPSKNGAKRIEGMRDRLRKPSGRSATSTLPLSNAPAPASSALTKRHEHVDSAMAQRVELFMAGVEERRSAHDAQMAEITESIEARLASLDQSVSERRKPNSPMVEGLASRGEALSATLEQPAARWKRSPARNADRQRTLSVDRTAFGQAHQPTRKCSTPPTAQWRG